MNPTDKQKMNDCHIDKTVFKQAISCPWSNIQPYPSSVNKNRPGDSSTAKTTSSSDSSTVTGPIIDQSQSLQQSSSQFFYFLRLMQLFPETHPATIHTVLSLSENDFFRAVDKLLYARRCKSVFTRNQTAGIRRHPLCRGHSYYCYTNDTCRGIKRSWDGDRVNQDRQQGTKQAEETIVTLNDKSGKVVANKEVLDLTIRQGDEKSATPVTRLEDQKSTDPSQTKIYIPSPKQ